MWVGDRIVIQKSGRDFPEPRAIVIAVEEALGM